MGIYQIQSFRGGLSDYEDKGIQGSFKFAANLDIRKLVDSLSAGQALVELGNTYSTSASISPSASSSPSSSPSSSASPSISPSSSPSPSIYVSPSASPSPSASRSPSGSMSPSSSLSPSSSVSPSPSPTSGFPDVFADLVIAWVNSSDGNLYGFGNTGKVYKITPTLGVSQVYDLRKPINGAAEKPSAGGNIYLEFATNTELHRKQIPGDPAWNDVNKAGTVQGDTWPKTNLSPADWHTMVNVGGDIMIGNNSFLAMSAYDDSYTNEALDLIPGKVVQTLLERTGRVVIGTFPAANPITGVNGMVDAEVPLAQIGNQGDVYYADFVNSVAVKRLICGGQVNPGGMTNMINHIDIFDWEQTALSWIDKQTIGNMALMGFYNTVAGKGGIYTAGRWNKNQPFVWNCEYQFDADEIGAVASAFGLVFFSYQLGAEYGVKVTDTQNKAVGVYEGLDFHAPIKTPLYITRWDWAELFFAPLPAGCKIQFWYRIEKEGEFIQAKIANQDATDYSVTGEQRCNFQIGVKGEIFEPRVVVIPNGNLTPEVYRIKIGFV